MKTFSILLLFLFLSFSYANEPQALDKYDLEWQESVEKAKIENDKLTDEQVMKHLEGVMKYLPEQLKEIKNQNNTELKQSMKNIRDFYTSTGMSINELNKLFEEQPMFLEMMAKTWFNDTVGVEYAETILLNLSNDEYKLILEEGIDLIQNRDSSIRKYKPEVFTDNLPKQLDFIKIEAIRVYEDYCEIFLYKGIGGMKSIGYSVQKDDQGQWALYHFNFLKNWDQTLIDLKD